MRKLLSLFLVTAFALTLGACENSPSPTEVETASELQASASSQSNPGGNGSGVVFEGSFSPAIAVFDASEGLMCIGAFADINDLNNFIKQQPNGHWSLHLEDHEVTYVVGPPAPGGGLADIVWEGSGRASASATFSEDPGEHEGDPFEILLNVSVQGTGTVENDDGDVRNLVCKSQRNQQGIVFSRVRLN